MAKTNITDYNTTPSANTDINGVGIADSNNAKGLRDGIQQEMAALARMNSGEAPLDDTFAVRDATDTSKRARLDAGNVPTSTSRALDAEALNRNGAGIMTVYRTPGNFTHTFAPSSRKYQLTGVGGGGGGGGVDGVVGGFGAGGGGSGGFHGFTDVLAVVGPGTIVIPTAASGGVSSADGASGGDVTWTDGTNAFTWGGGGGGRGVVANANGAISNNAPAGAATGNLYGCSQRGEGGAPDKQTPPSGRSGMGGNSPVGLGGFSILQTTDGATAGNNATTSGSGGGGGGAIAKNVITNVTGGDGAPGAIFVTEW